MTPVDSTPAASPPEPAEEARGGPLKKAEDVLGLVVGAALLIMVAGITVDALGRYLFASGLPGAMRITEAFLMPIVVFLSWSFAQRDRKHVAVDILHGRFRGTAARVLDRCIDLLGLVLFGLVLWTAVGYAADHWGLWTVEFPSIPTFPSRAIVVVGAAFMVLRLGTQVIQGRGIQNSGAEKGGE